MRALLQFAIVAGALGLWSAAQADDEKGKGHGDNEHVAVRPDEVKWGPGPPGLPPGVKAAVLVGNPTKAGPYVIRAKMPAGYKVPPHWHSSDENVTVIQGALWVGKGERFDADASKELPAGSFMRMPKTMRHFAWTKGETVIQVHGIGPFDINYINPADDPRKAE
jgi:quercetin dioxygenase-like cupin family protein